MLAYCRSRLPVPALVELAKNRSADLHAKALIPAIALFQADMPLWGRHATAPTDWAVLQQAKTLRAKQSVTTRSPAVQSGESGKPNDSSAAAGIRIQADDYPLAVTAAGLAPTTKNSPKSRFALLLLMFSLVAGLLFVGLPLSSSAMGNIMGTKVIRWEYLPRTASGNQESYAVVLFPHFSLPLYPTPPRPALQLPSPPSQLVLGGNVSNGTRGSGGAGGGASSYHSRQGFWGFLRKQWAKILRWLPWIRKEKND